MSDKIPPITIATMVISMVVPAAAAVVTVGGTPSQSGSGFVRGWSHYSRPQFAVQQWSAKFHVGNRKLFKSIHSHSGYHGHRR
jgi:hypothetical protein